MTRIICFMAISVLISGCWGVSSEFINLRKDLLKGADIVTFEKEIELSVNKLDLFIVEKFVSLDVNKMDWEIILSNISKVQLGVYNFDSALSYEHLNAKVTSFLRPKGWSNLLIQKDGNETNLLFLNVANPDKINEMLLFVVDDEQLVLIKIKGKLDKIIEYAIRKRGIKV